MRSKAWKMKKAKHVKGTVIFCATYNNKGTRDQSIHDARQYIRDNNYTFEDVRIQDKKLSIIVETKKEI